MLCFYICRMQPFPLILYKCDIHSLYFSFPLPGSCDKEGKIMLKIPSCRISHQVGTRMHLGAIHIHIIGNSRKFCQMNSEVSSVTSNIYIFHLKLLDLIVQKWMSSRKREQL
ncbi:hypothetical protein ABZP36_012396 [Zizania latifolia]